MHACGHDVHITSLIGTARRLAAMKDAWRGTVVFVVQPAEERIGGATRCSRTACTRASPSPITRSPSTSMPTRRPARSVADPGIARSSSDSIDIVIHGVGAHGASPHQGKDPIVMGAEIIMALQTLVSREISPLSPGVVTVGAFHAGSKHNIISDRAELQLTVRSDDEAVRKTLLDGIKRIAQNVGRMNGMPEDKLPEVKLSTESTPVTINDAGADRAAAHRLRAGLRRGVLKSPPRTGMGAEDFAYFIQPELGVPGFYFNVGGTPQAAFDAAKAGGPPVSGAPFAVVQDRSRTVGAAGHRGDDGGGAGSAEAGCGCCGDALSEYATEFNP